MNVSVKTYGVTSYFGWRKPALKGIRIVKRGENFYMRMKFDDGSRAQVKLEGDGQLIDIYGGV